MASSVDAVVLDKGYGTGETFDWSIIEDAGKMMEGRKVFLCRRYDTGKYRRGYPSIGCVWHRHIQRC